MVISLAKSRLWICRAHSLPRSAAQSLFSQSPVRYSRPCIKLATNSKMFHKLEEDMDINCGEILDGTVSVQEMGQKIFERGARTHAP